MTETTTDAATQDNLGGDVPQPDEQPAEAVITADSEPVTETTDDAEQVTEPVGTDTSEAGDDDVTEWAAKKGIDLTTPEGQAKALKSMREAEKKIHEKATQAADLKRQFEQAPAASEDERVQRLETLYSVSSWKTERGITPEQDQKMGDYLAADPVKIKMVTNGLLSLDEVFALSGASQVNPVAMKRQGGKEALETLANKQRATAPQGNASLSASPKVDPIAAALAD